MVSDLDIQRSAWVLIEKHGRDALSISGARHVELFEKGDMEGAAAWLRIDNAIVDLLFPEYTSDVEARAPH